MSRFVPNKGLYFYYEPLVKKATAKPSSRGGIYEHFFGTPVQTPVAGPQSDSNPKFFLCTGSDDYAVSYRPARASKNKDVPKLLIIRDNLFLPVGPAIIKAFESDLMDIDTAVKPKEETPEQPKVNVIEVVSALGPDFDDNMKFLNLYKPAAK